WRTRLDRIRGQIEGLGPQLGEETRRRLNTQRERLEAGFHALMSQREEAQRLWMVSRALYSHYQSFRSARRPEQALAAVRGMLSELSSAPESYRRLRQRNLTSLQSALSEFLRRQSAHPLPAWVGVREATVQVMQWIDPNYHAPEAVAPAAT